MSNSPWTTWSSSRNNEAPNTPLRQVGVGQHKSRAQGPAFSFQACPWAGIDGLQRLGFKKFLERSIKKDRIMPSGGFANRMHAELRRTHVDRIDAEYG